MVLSILSSHDRLPPLLIPLDPRADPLHRIPDPITLQRTNGQHPRISDPTTPLSLKDPADQTLLNPDRLDAILAILLVGQHKQGNTGCARMAQHALERLATFLQSANLAAAGGLAILCLGIRIGFGAAEGGRSVDVVAVADVAPVDDEDDGVADFVVARPHGPQGVLAAHVPDLEVDVGKVDGADVLTDGGDGGFVGERGGAVEGFDGREERRFAGVVEAEEEDGVFCWGGMVDQRRGSLLRVWCVGYRNVKGARGGVFIYLLSMWPRGRGSSRDGTYWAYDALHRGIPSTSNHSYHACLVAIALAYE